MKDVPSRLRWACRRGMLELDILLGNFLEEAYLGLTEADQALFVRLLSENDQNLFMWLTGKEVCGDAELDLMIDRVRHHAKHRHQH